MGGKITESFTTGEISANDNVGGIIGQSVGVTLTNSYSTVNISGDIAIGGIIGLNGGSSVISNSYAAGDITADTIYAGGVVGLNDGGTVENSYWNTDAEIIEDGSESITGIGENRNGASADIDGLTINEIKGDSAETNMMEFDFTDIWFTVSDDYPELQWKK